MVGKPSLTVPPNSSNSCRARSVLRSVVSMGSLRLWASGEQVSSPIGSVLHGLGEGAAQGAGVAACADCPEGFDLDLPGPLLGDAKLLGDLAQGEGITPVEAVAHLDDPGLTLGQRPNGLDERKLPLADLDARIVVARVLVRKQLAELGALFGVDPGIDAGDRLTDLAQTPGFLRLYAKPLDQLFLGRIPAELDAQGVLGASHAVDGIDNVRGQADGAGMVGDGTGDALADPPRSVGREAVAHLGVEFLDGPDQARVPLLDQVLEWHATPPVFLGDGDHEPQIRLDELLTSPHVPPAGPPREILLLTGVEQLATAHPAQILCENVACFHHYVSPLCLLVSFLPFDPHPMPDGFRKGALPCRAPRTNESCCLADRLT